MSRERWRIRELHPAGWVQRVDCNAVTVRRIVGVNGRLLERFDDATGARSRWNPCSHYKAVSTEGVPCEFVEDRENPTRWTYGGNFVPQFAGDVIFGVDADLCDPVPPPEVAGPISQRALINATRDVPMKVSIANFLWELKEGPKALLPRVQKWASGKTPADLLLWWKFGIEPTIRDVKELLKIWASAVKRLDHLKKVNRRLVTIRTHDGRAWCRGSDGPPEDSLAKSWNPLYPNLVSRRASHEVDVDITMQVYYDLQGLDGPLAFWNTLAASAGLANPAAIVWEGIPFSFVVDWFVRVGDWIDSNLCVPIFEGDIRVHSCYTTYHSRTLIDWYTPSSYEGGWINVGTTRVTGYHRRHGLPAGVLRTEGLTPMQQILGSALLVSQGGTTWNRSRFRRRH